MRAALVQAIHHARHRSAFGARLVDQPLMQNVLADLALEVEAATTLGLRLAPPSTRVTGPVAAGRRRRQVLGLQADAPMVAEALECLGGNGYVEEYGLARLYREAPLNSIWEGSGNIMALDVLRAITREPLSVEAFRQELSLAHGHSPVLDAAIARIDDVARYAAEPTAQAGARHVVEQLAVTLQATLLARFAPTEVADAFIASRLGRSARRPPSARWTPTSPALTRGRSSTGPSAASHRQ